MDIGEGELVIVMTPDDAIQHLQRQIDALGDVTDQDIDGWRHRTIGLVEQIFGSKSRQAHTFRHTEATRSLSKLQQAKKGMLADRREILNTDCLRSVLLAFVDELRDFDLPATLGDTQVEAKPERQETMPVSSGQAGRREASHDAESASQVDDMSRRVLFGLHGIRTHAGWCRALYEVGDHYGWKVRMDRWNFGYFSVLRFLLPWARSGKVEWFRKTYRAEVRDKDVPLDEGQYPSIVAHSFGTYILGNALLKYDWLKFNKVILCGSILPVDFPWDKLIERGQVQAVRNEFGGNDVWTRLVGWFVAGTGPSGSKGFGCLHERLEQERFEYTHSEYFDKGHMEAKWLPFLNRQLPTAAESNAAVERPRANRPWGLYGVYAILMAVLVWSIVHFWAGGGAGRRDDSRDGKTPMLEAGVPDGEDFPTSPHNYPSEKQVSHPPTQAQVDAPSQVSATDVTFLYKNASGVDLKLAVYDWSNHFHPLDLPLASANEPIIWDFPATNTFLPFSDFERSTGWFSFFVAEPGKNEWHELETRNIFYSEWPTLTVEATGDEERPFKPTFGFKE
ncbi:MAG: hypothetical protein RBS80_26110 [Thermoguttaceae bacterium]|jgi:hypothetical protein|nr:hypothetical protein [Thermoguttaceae bacterium]